MLRKATNRFPLKHSNAKRQKLAIAILGLFGISIAEYHEESISLGQLKAVYLVAAILHSSALP